ADKRGSETENEASFVCFLIWSIRVNPRPVLCASPSGQGAGLQIRYREFKSHRAVQNQKRTLCLVLCTWFGLQTTEVTNKVQSTKYKVPINERRCRVWHSTAEF